jgi:hypothetical protein
MKQTVICLTAALILGGCVLSPGQDLPFSGSGDSAQDAEDPTGGNVVDLGGDDSPPDILVDPTNGDGCVPLGGAGGASHEAAAGAGGACSR